jgi:hypothetical protein
VHGVWLSPRGVPQLPGEVDNGQALIEGRFLIDAHVHCHPCFAQAAFLDHAEASFCAAAHEFGVTGRVVGSLLFAELPPERYFEALSAGELEPSGWRLERTCEPTSLIARGRAGMIMVLIAGCQIATAEGLEVLALGTRARFAAGQSLPATVAAVRGQGALAVVPWGFGKWWGRRGRAVMRWLEELESDGVFLGDNAGRPAGWPPPKQFAAAAERGIFVLPGSDPLPLPAEADRVARYGLAVEGAIDRERPTAGLLQLLAGLRVQPETFGRRQDPASCLARQLAMQWRKHRRTA